MWFFNLSRRLKCNKGQGNIPIYVNVHMMTGDLVNTWIDALQAAWPGVQVCRLRMSEHGQICIPPPMFMPCFVDSQHFNFHYFQVILLVLFHVLHLFPFPGSTRGH